MPGVASEAARDASAIHEIVLQGPPWSQNSSYNLHARSMLLMMIKDLSTYGWKLVATSDATAKYVICHLIVASYFISIKNYLGFFALSKNRFISNLSNRYTMTMA
jgi:hypothetical protein